MYLFDPYWDEKSKTWNAYCSRSEFDFPAKSSYESLFFRMLVLPFNKLPITYKSHVQTVKKSKSYLFLIHLEKRHRPFWKKPLLFLLLFCFCMINIIGTLYIFSHNLSVHTFAKKLYTRRWGKAARPWAKKENILMQHWITEQQFFKSNYQESKWKQ